MRRETLSAGEDRSALIERKSSKSSFTLAGYEVYSAQKADDCPERRSRISSMIFSALLGPIPSIRSRIRFHATTSLGFSMTRRYAIISFTWAVSMNLYPPNFTNGIFAFVSSISRSKEWKEERKSTAISSSGTPSSRRSRIFWTTNFDWLFSSSATTSCGSEPPDLLEEFLGELEAQGH